MKKPENKKRIAYVVGASGKFQHAKEQRRGGSVSRVKKQVTSRKQMREDRSAFREATARRGAPILAGNAA